MIKNVYECNVTKTRYIILWLDGCVVNTFLNRQKRFHYRNSAFCTKMSHFNLLTCFDALSAIPVLMTLISEITYVVTRLDSIVSGNGSFLVAFWIFRRNKRKISVCSNEKINCCLKSLLYYSYPCVSGNSYWTFY